MESQFGNKPGRTGQPRQPGRTGQPHALEVSEAPEVTFALAGGSAMNPTRPTSNNIQDAQSGRINHATEVPQIVLPHGGYKKLLVYRKSDIIYQGTVAFCRRFLPPRGDRTVDQMTQAARSCKQNIAEGSAASGTSKETEIKLTNVARATLDELIEDYLDWLKTHGAVEWPMDDKRRIAARGYAKEHSDWEAWQSLLETRPGETVANLMLTLCHQTRYMLDKMIAVQEEDFKKHGGVRERMHAARTAARGEEWDKGIYSRLFGAQDAVALAATAAEIKRKVDRMVWSIRQRKGWR